MKVGNITETQETFSFKNQRYSDSKYILSVRDEHRYEYNVIPLIYIDNGKLIDLDSYEFGNKLFATRPPHFNPNNIEDLPLSRFHKNQLIKIDYGTIIENTGAENPYMPKVKTFNANIHPIAPNQIIEFFDGMINQAESLFTPDSYDVFDLIKNVYLETENSFFITSGDKAVGPFIALKLNDDSFEISKSSWRKFGEYEMLEDSYLEFEINDLVRKIYITDSKDLNIVYNQDYIFVSDDELLKQFETELTNYPEYFNESSLENIKKILQRTSELKSLEKIIQENDRLKGLVEKSERILTQNADLINFFPGVKTLKEDQQRVKEELFIANRELETIQASRKEIEQDISNLQLTRTQEIESRQKELDEQINTLELRKNNLEKEVQEEKNKLERSLKEIQENITNQRIIEGYLQAGVKKLQDEFTSEQKDAQYKLAELVKGKAHFDFISGRDLSEQEGLREEFNTYVMKDRFNSNQYRDFRNELLSILKTNNRSFTTHFIDNLLISIFQNTLTVFAGVPGTGKTTLARLLTNILSPSSKVREISVNRGWSSQKDFIGFVNPLTKKFHSSSTDLYSLLKQMNHESKDSDVYLKTPMSFVILDEANLSPLEHYWSSFYNLTDSTGMLEIKLGHNEAIRFPNNLRFIGTINYDHTTEELSPRVLDRINVIQLTKNEDISYSDISGSNIQNLQITFQRCIEFFELSNFTSLEIDDRIDKGFKEIKNEFRKLKIFISPRVEIAVKRYIALASKFMSDVNKPLDYCVAQRMLPLISLQGSENKQKLESLKETLKENKCEISVRILDEIISIGTEKGVYEENFNYFLTLSNV